jgi:gamma-glutamyl hercynylcysteine S-oxide synthase
MILRTCISLLLLFALTDLCNAQENRFRPQGSQIPGPRGNSPQPGWLTEMQGWTRERPSEFQSWLEDIKAWRAERLIRIGYNDAEYRRPEFAWTQGNLVAPQVMVEDRYLYDSAAGKFTVDRYLADLRRRYGGIDAVLVWPVYPNLGIDDRNLFDFYRDLPGGLTALRAMVGDFHRRDVKVFFPMMPWDVGTRPEGAPLWDSVAKLMADLGADGVNGDTFSGVPRAFRDASDRTGHPVVFQPENDLSGDEQLIWNTQSWGYWDYSWEPKISKLKWLEPRHMVNVCNRWARDKTDDLQYAFFNGAGYVSWENIWGIWNGITPRDAEALRRIANIERRFSPMLGSSDWVPHTPVLQFGAFASKFPSGERILWTFVNRNKYDLAGDQVRIAHHPGARYFDVYHGVELQPKLKDGTATLAFEMEGLGYGAILSTSQPDSGLPGFLGEMERLTAKPLRDYSAEWRPLPQKVVDIAATRPAKADPEGMVAIPAGSFDFRVSGVEIEGSNDEGVDTQYPWEPSPRRHHLHTTDVKKFYIDRYPVTNREFKAFVDGAVYRPADDHNFLRHWKNGAYPEGSAKKPVVWVSLEDARAYAKWAGKRLPHEWEWQYAAQGNDGRTYPWGSDWNPNALPAADHGRTMEPPADVDAHPEGASPFGVMDLVGNVWQWTDEYVDDHTRAAILRGSSHYHPTGSLWYFPAAYKLSEHGKLLLIAPSKDRSGAVGFRCVVDAE